MKLMVTGGRDYADRERAFRVLDALHKNKHFTVVIHGACGWDADKPSEHLPERLRGADRFADEWARSRGIEVERVAAEWTRLGGIAGPVRNEAMLGRVPDLVVAFPGGAGTANAKRLARVRRVTVLTVNG